tara:strand:+ start:136 stop:528 length:393 start_codon:yes stop_codon:yes gene_type:complete
LPINNRELWEVKPFARRVQEATSHVIVKTVRSCIPPVLPGQAPANAMHMWWWWWRAHRAAWGGAPRRWAGVRAVDFATPRDGVVVRTSCEVVTLTNKNIHTQNASLRSEAAHLIFFWKKICFLQPVSNKD